MTVGGAVGGTGRRLARRFRAGLAPRPVRGPAASAAAPTLALIALSVLAAVSAASAASGRSAILLQQCVSGDGVVGRWGMGLALLHTSADCPAGALALGPDHRQALTLVVTIAVPALAAHLLTAAGGLWLAGLVRRTVALVRELLSAAGAHRLPTRPPARSAVPDRGLVRATPVRRMLRTRLWIAHLNRGPPLAATG